MRKLASTKKKSCVLKKGILKVEGKKQADLLVPQILAFKRARKIADLTAEIALNYPANYKGMKS